MLPKPKKPKWGVPAVRPDRDKLERFVMDALEGVVWKNDAQIISGWVEKRYGKRPGVHIVVYDASGQEDLFDEEVRVLRGGVREGPTEQT